MSETGLTPPLSEVFTPQGWTVDGPQTGQISVLANFLNTRDLRLSQIPIIRGGGMYKSTEPKLLAPSGQEDRKFLSQSARLAIIPARNNIFGEEVLTFFPTERTEKPFSENFYTYRGIYARWLREKRSWDKLSQTQFPLPQVLDHQILVADGRVITVTEYRQNLQSLGLGTARETVEEMDISKISIPESRKLIRLLNYLNGDAEEFTNWVKTQGGLLDLPEKSWVNPYNDDRFLRGKDWWQDRKAELVNWVNGASAMYSEIKLLDKFKEDLVATIDHNIPIFPKANGENPDGMGCSHVIAHGTVFPGQIHLTREDDREVEITTTGGDRAHFAIPGDDPAALIASAVKSPDYMSAMIDEFYDVQVAEGRNVDMEMRGLGMHLLYRCIGAIKYYSNKPNYEGKEAERLVKVVKSIVDNRAEGKWWKVIEDFKDDK